MIRKVTLGFAVVFAVVVAIGYVPRFVEIDMGERLVFGLFRISALDDITHGLTAVMALVAGASSRRASLLFLTAFGWYYALDAIFFLLYGFVNDKPFIADIMLNAPHVAIAAIMLGLVYGYAPREDAAKM